MNNTKCHNTGSAELLALPRLMRLAQVLEQIPISKSAWWQGVKDGKYPAPRKLGPRTTVWLGRDIETLIAALGNRQHGLDSRGGAQ